MKIIFEVLKESLKITLFVMVMMLAIDIVNVKTRNKLSYIVKNGGRLRQYIFASVLAVIPGCFGSFAGVSLYIHGMMSFGALTGLMFAASGDEMFIMLAMFPKTALTMMIILFVLGILAGFLTDILVKRFNISTSSDCRFERFHINEAGYKHFLKEHVWKHLIKGHLLKMFIWTFGTLIIVETGLQFIDLKSISSSYTYLLLIVSALIGIIPESGPHLLFVILFAKGLIPFSVLFTSSVVQDGHGMLPMLSFSVKDSFRLKVLNFIYGVFIGTCFYLLGY